MPKTATKKFINREKVSLLCKERKLTQKKLGDYAGIPEGTMKSCLNKRRMTSENIQRIARVLDVTEEFLTDQTEERTSYKENYAIDSWGNFMGIIQNMIDDRNPVFPILYIEALNDIRESLERCEIEAYHRHKWDCAYYTVNLIQKTLLREAEHLFFVNQRIKHAIEQGDMKLLQSIVDE